MKKVLFVLLAIAAVLAGYLVYDWITVSHKRANAPVVYIYSWKDAQGLVHFSDKPPPPGAVEIQKTEGQAYVAPPLVLRVKETAAEWINKAKEGISKRSDKRSDRKSKK
ncbi:MAG: hypothetical protein AMJ54_08425 [Deltaproteobacteria bacterium SG8_13]|nr:MAG: hypothetical protein AMJ54_08425 [Deltaproteobacteria bacterium SG8_13]